MESYDITPLEGFAPELGLLTACLIDSSREWREELGEVSDECVCWQPYPTGYSIGALILHMIGAETWWIEEVSLGRPLPANDVAVAFDATVDQEHRYWPAPPRKSLQWYYDLQDRSRSRLIELLKEHDDVSQLCPRHGSEVTLRWIMTHLIQHDSYTGGQAVMLSEMYKRLQRDALELGAPR